MAVAKRTNGVLSARQVAERLRAIQEEPMENLQKSCSRLLSMVDTAMAQYEGELALLRKYRASLIDMVGDTKGMPRRKGASANSLRQLPKSPRVKWDEVLALLPRRFNVADVMKHPGPQSKGVAQVYPALNRWETAKLVKRIGKGRYEKLPARAKLAA